MSLSPIPRLPARLGAGAGGRARALGGRVRARRRGRRALALTRFLAGQLFEVSPTDPPTFVAVVAAIGAVALAACLAPARRAARLDPVTTLRAE